MKVPALASLLAMDFPERLIQLRKARALTQRQLGEQISVHLTQVQRYENGSSQPTLDVLRRLAVVLGVSADVLLFDAAERGPEEALKLRFEALRQFDADERRIAEGVLDSLIVQHQAKRLFVKPVESAPAPVPKMDSLRATTPPASQRSAKTKTGAAVRA